MATYTENYAMTLPEREDGFNILIYNENFETIDSEMAATAALAEDMNEKLGTPEEGETVFSLLKNSGGSIIKSVQTVSATINTNSSATTTLNINPVNPTKCIVLMNRVEDATCGAIHASYTLKGSTLQVETGVKAGNILILQFQIIEFN